MIMVVLNKAQAMIATTAAPNVLKYALREVYPIKP